MSQGRRKVEWSVDLGNLRARAGQIVTDAIGAPLETKRATLQERRDGAISLRLELGWLAGRVRVKALEAGSPLLFQAALRYVGEYEYAVSGAAERVISLRQAASSQHIGKARDLHCDVALARDLRIELALGAGLGECEIDLSQLRAAKAVLKTGVGALQLTAPGAADFAAQIDGGVGKTAVTIPAGGGGRFKIRGGVGAVTVWAAADAAIRLNAGAGLGRIDLAETFAFETKRGKGKRRRYETAEFGASAAKIEIDYSGGVGSFRLAAIEA